MELLREFFDPIPLAAMIAAVFAIAAVLVFSRIFRMPPDFAIKEQFRNEVKSRIIGDRMAEKLIEEAQEAKRLADAAEQETQQPADTPASAEPA